MAPHLIQAQSTYKDIRIGSDHHACMHTRTHTHTHAHTHTHMYMHKHMYTHNTLGVSLTLFSALP